MPLRLPATIESRVLDDLVHFLNHEEPTPFDIKRIEKDIAALEKVDRGEGYAARAALCALRWDLEGAQAWSERACTIDGAFEVANNAAISMRFLNRPDLGVEYGLLALRRAPALHEVAEVAVGLLVVSGRMHEALAVVQDFEASRGEKSWCFDVQSICAQVDNIGLSEERLRIEIRAALDVLTAHKIRHNGFSVEESSDPDGGSAMVVFVGFEGTLEDELSLEAELAEKLADDPDWDPCRLSVELTHTTQENAGQPT